MCLLLVSQGPNYRPVCDRPATVVAAGEYPIAWAVFCRASIPWRREHDLPVALHADHVPAFGEGVVPGLVEAADLALPVVSDLALAVVVQHQQCQTRAAAAHRVLQHLPVAVGVAERQDRPPADV